ncbi:ATP-binding protein, partial [Sphingobacterium faecium]|uniref:ATP-binding protein n=1 Tax=Sphingobacterium faecium TaxID=34087 RepID=UPI00188533A0
DNENFKKNAKFILIDFNGEYAVEKDNDNIIIDKEHKNRFFLSTSKPDKDKFPIPESEVNDLTFWSILLKATDQTQKPFLDSCLGKKTLQEAFTSKDGIIDLFHRTVLNILIQSSKNIDKDFHIYFINELNKIHIDGLGVFTNLNDIKRDLKLNLTKDYSEIVFKKIDHSKEPANFISEIWTLTKTLEFDLAKIDLFTKIRLQVVFHYFEVIAKGYYSREHIGPLYNRLENKFKEITKVFRIENSKYFTDFKPFTIINLNDVNVEMKKIIPLVICKYFYNQYKNNNLDREKYLNIIIDEAHNILSRNSIRESETWKDYRLETFEEIIKEGRKFGVFLTISSQRPYDISDTIISQLHNYFLHRLINNKDIEAIGRTVSYLDKISFDSLSILPQGGCILAGLSADLPVVIKVDPILEEHKPHNETIVLSAKWK